MTPLDPPAGLEFQTDAIWQRARRSRSRHALIVGPLAAVATLAYVGIFHAEAPLSLDVTPARIIVAISVVLSCLAVSAIYSARVRGGRHDTHILLHHGLDPAEQRTVRHDIARSAPNPDPALRYVETQVARRIIRLHAFDWVVLPVLGMAFGVKLALDWRHPLSVLVASAALGSVIYLLVRDSMLVEPAKVFLRTEADAPRADCLVAYTPETEATIRSTGEPLSVEDFLTPRVSYEDSY